MARSCCFQGGWIVPFGTSENAYPHIGQLALHAWRENPYNSAIFTK